MFSAANTDLKHDSISHKQTYQHTPKVHVYLHELRVVDVEHDGVLDVVGIAQHELEELGGAERRTDGVLGGDGRVQHVQNAVFLVLLTVQLDRLQVT